MKTIGFLLTIILVAVGCSGRAQHEKSREARAIEPEVRAFCGENALILREEWGASEQPRDTSVAEVLDLARAFEATPKGGQGQRYMLLRKPDGLILNVGEIGNGATVVAVFRALNLRAKSENSATRLTKLASQLTTDNAMRKGCTWKFTVEKTEPYHVSGACHAPDGSQVAWVLWFKARYDLDGTLLEFSQYGDK